MIQIKKGYYLVTTRENVAHAVALYMRCKKDSITYLHATDENDNLPDVYPRIVHVRYNEAHKMPEVVFSLSLTDTIDMTAVFNQNGYF